LLGYFRGENDCNLVLYLTTKQVFENFGRETIWFPRLVADQIVSISNLKNTRKMSALPPPGKIPADAHIRICEMRRKDCFV